MFKLESYISPLLMGYLDKYVKLRQEDFQLSLWGGDAILNNLDLRLDELEKIIQLPVMFQSGHIHELRLHVPWTKLGSEPVVITINTVECIVKVRDTAYDGGSTSNSSEAAAKAAYQRSRRRDPEAEALPPGYLQSIINRIVNNVTFVINNLILKFVEDDIVLSVNIKSGECYSVDRDWNRAFVDLTQEDLALRKVLNFADLTICIDKTNASGHIESYQEPMAYRCAVTCRLHMDYEQITSKFPKATRFNVYCDVLNLTLTDTQLPMFVRLVELCIAMYYGTLDIPTASENPTDGNSSIIASKNASDTVLKDTSYDFGDGEENQGWASWAWSYVPQILPAEEEEGMSDDLNRKSKRARRTPLILSLGFYIHQGNIVFKLTEKAKDSSELPHKKMHFHPFLSLAFEGASLEVLIQGLTFCNVQSGISALRLFTCGNCICGVADDSVNRCNTLLTGGEPLKQKMSVSYLSNSLFDAMSFENQGHSAHYILDGDQHRQAYTEQYALQKFGAFWVDYLYTFEKPKKHVSAGSHSSDTDVSNAIFDKEFSTLRFLLGNSHLVFSSTFYHRVSKFVHCMGNHQYEPYGTSKSQVPSDDRPKPTEEQIMSLEEFIPTQLIHVALINPSAVILTSEHEECDLKKKQYKSRHRKRKNKHVDSPQPQDLACVAIGASRFDLQITKPMYPGRLVKLVSAIAGPSSNLLHHCHHHMQIKLFSLQAGLQRASSDGKMCRPLTLVPPCSFALYSRSLLLPKLWNNTSLPISEWMYEIPYASINLNKASVIMATRILSSWVTPKTKQMEILDDSLLDDLFPPSGESTSQTYPLLEFNLCGLEFKSCSSCLVDAYTGSLSSVQVFLYTPGTGGRMAVVPILSSPADTSQLTNPEFFTTNSSLSEGVSSDCITATVQKPKNTGIRQAQALALVDCQGLALWLDPVLMSWFHYCPQLRPVAPSGQPAVSLDMSLAQLTSPLNTMSQASVHSTSSPSHQGRSQAQASSQTTKQAGDKKSQPTGEEKEKKKEKAMKEEGKNAEKETMAEILAGFFPLIQALHLQVDIKSSVLFLPKTSLPTTVESTSDIIGTVQQAIRDGHLSPTLVICLPAILVTSTMTRPMNVLQELPVTDFHESLIGEKLPWTIKLSNTCIYSLFPGRSQPSFLLQPVDVVSTLAINCTYNPPTSEQISGLAFCVHTDVGAPHTTWTSPQLHLLSIVSALVSNLSKDSVKLYKECVDMFMRRPEPEVSFGHDQANLRISSSSATHKMDSVMSGEVTEQLTTDVSEDLSHDASPIHESLIDSEEENGIKLSLWLQLMVSKLECQMVHTCARSHRESALSCVLEAFDLSLDSQSVYSKVKMTLGSLSVQHAWKGSDGSWCWTDPEGVIVSCTRQLPRHLHTVSNKLWLAENSVGMSFAQSHDTSSREKKHGVLSITLTHALCKNVKRRLRKANVELPILNEQETCSSSTGYDPDYLYFHEYLTEVCLKVGPVDAVLRAEAVDVILGMLSGVGNKSQSVRKSAKCDQNPVFVSVQKPQEDQSPPLASFAVHNLPLLYADVGLLRIFVPLPQSENRQPSPYHQSGDSSNNSHNKIAPSKDHTPVFPASSHISKTVSTSSTAILSQPRAENTSETKINDSVSNISNSESHKSSMNDPECDQQKVASTLDHDLLVIQVCSFVLQPHAENPLPRTACDKELFYKAGQSGMSYQPGASVEDRQYQMDVRGLALSTGCWNQVTREMRKAEQQKSPTGSMVQIPALDWNTFLMDSVADERKDIKLVPLATAFDICLVVAPPIFCLPQQDKETLWKQKPHLVCGLTMELNLTSDLDLYLSTSQLEFITTLNAQLSERFNPHPHTIPATALSTGAINSALNKTHEGFHSLPPLSYLAADHTLPGNRGGDSGVESDISTLILDHGHKAGADRGHLGPATKQTEERMNLSSLGTPFTGSPKFDKIEKKMNEKGTLLSSRSFFDLLVTAGRISCTVYMHKIVDESVTLEMPHFQDKRSNSRVRHQTSYTPKAMGMPAKDNLDERLKCAPRRGYSVTDEQGEEADEENEESSDSYEEEFTEFSFMKSTPDNGLKKIIPEGTVCVQPFVYLYLTQPHCILSNHGGNQMKAELSCYDVLVKGASDNHLSAIDDYHIIPDCADFNVHWLETRAGQPHPYTGIPPSLLTAQFLREPNMQDSIGFHLDRPLRLKVSQLAIEQIASFTNELTSLFATSTAKKAEKDFQGEKLPDSSSKSLSDCMIFADKINLSTSQVVVAIEMNENDSHMGGTLSLEGFKMEVDLQKTESDCNPLITSHVKDVLVKLSLEKKSRPLIGPLTVNIDACLSWIPISENNVRLQVLLVVDTGVVQIRFGQDHIFCMMQLVQKLTKMQQDLKGKLSHDDMKPTERATSVTEKRRHVETSKAMSSHITSDFVKDFSHDDLRSGGFKFVDTPEGPEIPPEPNEIVFGNSCSYNNSRDASDLSPRNSSQLDSSYMAWCYSHPRVITSIQLTPVPFSLTSSTMSLDSSSLATASVPCVLQYYDELLGDYLDVVKFFLSESESVSVPFPEAKPCSANQLMVAKLWRVVLLQSNEGRGDVAVLPASLAACMRVDSAFIPSLIPDLQVSLNLPLAEIVMCHHLENNGRDLPMKLSQYQPVFDLVEEQQFAVLKLSDIQMTASHLSKLEQRLSLKANLTTSLDVMEYGHLSLMPVISPATFSLSADLVSNGKGHEVDAQVQAGKMRVAVGKSVVHSINMALTAWTHFDSKGSGPHLIFSHFVICNNTMSTIRLGQVGTEENIALHSKQMYAYSWRSLASAQMLHLCINKPSWKWTEPFPIDTVGTWVRCVNARDQDYVLIIKVTALTSVQKQVTISGQLLVSNQLSQPISLKVCSSGLQSSSSSQPLPTSAATSSFDPSNSSTQPAPSSQMHHYVIQAGSTLPSLVASEIHNHPIQFRLAGFSTAWSHEIYLSGDNMKDNQLVKIPLPDDNAYFHIWCRIFCQHFQGKDQKLVMLTPLYVVRTHLPRPLFIHLDTSKLKGSQELLTRSQGHEFQFHCMGGDITHNMSFRLGSGKQLSSPPVVLSTGLIEQLERKPLDSIDIDKLCSQKFNTMQHDWPFLMEAGPAWDLDPQDASKSNSHLHQCTTSSVELEEQDDGDTQPSIDLNVRLSEYIPGCETLLVEVTPSCLVTNVTDLCLIVGEMTPDGQIGAEKQWRLKAGHTISPPLPNNHFMLAIEQDSKLSSWTHIPLSDESSDYKRYNEDIGKVLFIDSHVPVSFSLLSSPKQYTEMVFLTVTSDFHHGIRTICIKEQLCISNKCQEALIIKPLALPLSSPKVSVCDTAVSNITLTNCKKSEKEVQPLAKWSLVDSTENGSESKKEAKNREENYVFYLSFARGDQCGDLKNHIESSWYWSVPVRINLTKGSHRMTTSLPCSDFGHNTDHTSTHQGNSEVEGSNNHPAMTQALCVSTHQSKGVTYLVVMEDTAPVIVVENLCPFALEFGQAVSTGNSQETVIQEQLELVSDLPWVPPGGWSHYTMPGVNVEYGNKETLTMPRMLFRVKPGFGLFDGLESTDAFKWSAAVQVAGLDAFIRLQGICDLKVKMEIIGMEMHLIIRPVSKAEITAKEIRSRLKTQESESVRSVLPSSSAHGEASADDSKRPQNEIVVASQSDATKSKAFTEPLMRFTETPKGQEMVRNQTWFKLSIGCHCSSVAIVVQEESTPGEVAEILSFLIEDLYVASFPLSHNPSFIGSENCFAISVGYAQLDNQQYGNDAYDFPVIFLPQALEKDTIDKSTFSDVPGQMSVMESLAVFKSKAIFHAQVVTFSDHLWSQSALESVECSIQPISLYVEDTFVYRLIEELEMFAPSKLIMTPLPSSQLDLIHSKLPPAAAFNARMLSQPVRIKQLTIHPIKMLLSVHASLKLFLASDQTPLNLAKFERMQVFSSTQRLLHAVTMHYASAAIFRAGIVVGSLEILGNPTGLVRSISAGVSDLVRLPYSGLTRGPVAFVGGVSRGLGSLVRNVSAGMITSVTNFASSVSRNMDRLSLDTTHKERQEQNRRNRPSGMSDGLIQGLTGFGLSLLGAVAGLADQPIRNVLATSSDRRSSSATSAASGLVTGVGKGLVGMLTKPIGGAAELVSQTGQGILHGTGLGQMPTRAQLPATLLRSSLPCSAYKYCVKLFSTLPSPTILLAVPALTFDMMGSEVKVVLVLTSDVLVVVNVEEDCQQLTLSLSELECQSFDMDDEEEDGMDGHDGQTGEEAPSVDRQDLYDNDEPVVDQDDVNEDDGSNDDDAYSNGKGLTSEMDGYQSKITIVWTDHYYNSSVLEHTQKASKERVAAFIDSTQNLTAGLVSPDVPISSHQRAAPTSSLPDQCLDTESPPQLRRSVSDSSQVETAPTLSAACRVTDSPQYDFKMNIHWKLLFVTMFHSAKHRLQGQGFSV